MNQLTNFQMRDVDSLLHPTTNLAAHRSTGPLVLDRAEGEPVAILKNSRCVGYFVPVEYVQRPERPFTTMERVVDSIRGRAE